MQHCARIIRDQTRLQTTLATLLGTTLLLVSAGSVAAQETGTISGRISDQVSRRPIPAAVVRLVGTDLGAVTDVEGRFRIEGVRPGRLVVEVEAFGYAPLRVGDLGLSELVSEPLQLTLVPKPIAVEAITVRPAYFPPANESMTSTQTLGIEETRMAPGTFEDVIRSVTVLPGIAIPGDGRNDLVVRGGAPYENLFLVDGIPVPNPNHFGSQGSTGGPISLVNMEFVRDVSFSSGGFGVSYGNRTSSLTNVSLRPGNTERVTGEINLSATGFGGIVEGPLGNGSFMFGARRSYLDLIFKAAGEPFIPQYWDFNFKVTQLLGDSDQLDVLAIGALDDVSFNNTTADNRYDNSRVGAPSVDQYVAGATWTHFFDDASLRATVGRTVYNYETVQRDSLLQDVFRNESTEAQTSLRLEYNRVLGETTSLLLGNEATYADELGYDIVLDGNLRFDDQGRPRPLVADTTFSAFQNGTYGQLGFAISERVMAEAGTRVDYYELYDAWRLSPRVGLSFALDERTAVNLSVGRYYQAPSNIWLVGDPENIDTLEPFYADQIVASYQRLIREDLKFQVEGYYKAYGDYPGRVWRPQAVLSPAGFEDATNDIPFGLEPLASVAEGRAYGAEFFLQKRFSELPVYGLASLSVGRSLFTSLDVIERTGTYDTRVTGTVLGGYRLGRDWMIGGRFRFDSGRPSTPFIESGPYEGQRDFSRYNEDRLPAFHALDLRVDRRWNWGDRQLTVYVDVQNVYARANVTQLYWDRREGEATFSSDLTILPTIGVNIAF